MEACEEGLFRSKGGGGTLSTSVQQARRCAGAMEAGTMSPAWHRLTGRHIILTTWLLMDLKDKQFSRVLDPQSFSDLKDSDGQSWIVTDSAGL